ncbi:hypothetical protein [Glutamicibacter sp. AOP5-A2-18]|uniref:hypothetical protein n=1 Tax=Glutamicibacter sp. AOP5-A2-18 TaxID=3457656 RepID=UPI004033B9D8
MKNLGLIQQTQAEIAAASKKYLSARNTSVQAKEGVALFAVSVTSSVVVGLVFTSGADVAGYLVIGVFLVVGLILASLMLQLEAFKLYNQGRRTSLGLWAWTETKSSRARREAAAARAEELEAEIIWKSEMIEVYVAREFENQGKGNFVVFPDVVAGRELHLGIRGTENIRWAEHLGNPRHPAPMVKVVHADGQQVLKALSASAAHSLVLIDPLQAVRGL